MADPIQLEKIPSQAFNITLGDHNYDLRIYSIDGHMAYDLDIDKQREDDPVNNPDKNWLINGFKLVNEVMLLPYKYQEINGNLLLVVPDNELPDYTRFESSQFLYYLTAEEAAQYRGAFDAGLTAVVQ